LNSEINDACIRYLETQIRAVSCTLLVFIDDATSMLMDLNHPLGKYRSEPNFCIAANLIFAAAAAIIITAVVPTSPEINSLLT